VAIVRVSGPEAIAVADRVLEGVDLGVASPRTAHRGFVVSPAGDRIDEVLATVFRAPNSYTGEDMVELSCHGGHLPPVLVLSAVLEAGARPASPGEFTKRAYLNGKMDLSQAGAVAEIVGAKSRAALKAALARLGGALSARVRAVRDVLVGALAEIEARIDFTEDVDEPLDARSVHEALVGAAQELDELARACELGRLAREGARMTIAGPPNVGKSSILNALVSKERAIVTPVPGTTRDAIEEWVELDGLLLTFVDTAGLRPTVDPVEAEGVRRTRALVRESRLVLAVFEAPAGPTEAALELVAELAAETPVIPVLNKTDLGVDRALWEEALGAVAGRDAVLPPSFTCALTGEGIEALRGRVVAALLGKEMGPPVATDIVLADARLLGSIQRAQRATREARETLAAGGGDEIVALELATALQALGEVTGESAGEEVLEAIFSRFCVGK